MTVRPTRHCPQCNEDHDVDPDEMNCPHCGVRLSAWINDPTVDLEATNELESFAEDQEPAEKLVGQPFANYQIERFLGQGGMARVYLATHQSLQRPCAVKVLRPSTLVRGERAIESFLSEARLSAAINHPHAVTLYTLGHCDGRQFLEMEYVDGKTLDQLVREHGQLNPLQATAEKKVSDTFLGEWGTFGRKKVSDTFLNKGWRMDRFFEQHRSERCDDVTRQAYESRSGHDQIRNPRTEQRRRRARLRSGFDLETQALTRGAISRIRLLTAIRESVLPSVGSTSHLHNLACLCNQGPRLAVEIG